MSMRPQTALALDSYQLRLPAFEGPLDVLLRLIERDQLSLNEVSLLAVLDQFMAFARGLDMPAPEVIAEFAAVAGRLSLLKSRALLPKPPRALEDPDDPDDLVRQLEEYRALKIAAGLLAYKQQLNNGAFSRGDGVAVPVAVATRMTPQEPSALAKAVHRWLSRVPKPLARILSLPVISLREMTERIIAALGRDQDCSFGDIRSKCHGRQEVAVAFLAVLVLLRRHVAVAVQEELFGPILLTPAPDRPHQVKSVGGLEPESIDGRD